MQHRLQNLAVASWHEAARSEELEHGHLRLGVARAQRLRYDVNTVRVLQHVLATALQEVNKHVNMTSFSAMVTSLTALFMSALTQPMIDVWVSLLRVT